MSAPVGLYLTPNFISPEEETNIIAWLDAQPWSDALSRRTQHYGYIYDYKSKNVNHTPAPPISGPLLEIANKLRDKTILNPVQCIVNEYYYNQGIAAHIDNRQFGNVIITISLNADAIMNFTRDITKIIHNDSGTPIYIQEKEQFDAFLPRRSIAMLSQNARYEWKHEIKKTATYFNPITQTKVTKPKDYRRISLTFRELV